MKEIIGKLVMLGSSAWKNECLQMIITIFLLAMLLAVLTGVGKTSLIVRYVNKYYPTNIKETVGASFLTCNIMLKETKVKLQVWDTAGQERFKSMAPMYYRNANVAFLVFDLTNYNTFVAIKNWVTELKRNIDYPILLVIIGNKSDLLNERQIDNEEGLNYASSIGASYYETSVLLDEGINRLFVNTAKDLVILDSNDAQQIKDLGLYQHILDSDNQRREGFLVPSSEEGPLCGSIADGIKERSFCC